MMEEQNTELPFLTENGSQPTSILPPPVIPASQGSTGIRLKDSTSGFVGRESPSTVVRSPIRSLACSSGGDGAE